MPALWETEAEHVIEMSAVGVPDMDPVAEGRIDVLRSHVARLEDVGVPSMRSNRPSAAQSHVP